MTQPWKVILISIPGFLSGRWKITANVAAPNRAGALNTSLSVPQTSSLSWLCAWGAALWWLWVWKMLEDHA